MPIYIIRAITGMNLGPFSIAVKHVPINGSYLFQFPITILKVLKGMGRIQTSITVILMFLWLFIQWSLLIRQILMYRLTLIASMLNNDAVIKLEIIEP